MPAYIAVQVDVKDPDTYARYRALAPASIAAHEGRYLVRGGACTTLEGSWLPSRFVILEFPTREHARVGGSRPNTPKPRRSDSRAQTPRWCWSREFREGCACTLRGAPKQL